MDGETPHELALESIKVHLQGQGLTPRIVEGALLIGVGDLLCRCEILPSPSDVETTIVPVGIELVLGETGRSIRNIVVGMAENRAEAIIQAGHTWTEGVFPPVRRLFEESSSDKKYILTMTMAAQNMETGAVTDWHIHAGLLQADGTESENFLDPMSKVKILSLLIGSLGSAANDVRFHWIKIYMGRLPDGKVIIECKLDNEDWAEGVEALHGFQWPKGNDFLQFRQFLVMVPTDKANAKVREELSAYADKLLEKPKKKFPRWWPFGR